MILFALLIQVALAANVVTVYNTKFHTVVNYKTEVATNIITLWTTAGILQEDSDDHVINTADQTTTSNSGDILVALGTKGQTTTTLRPQSQTNQATITQAPKTTLGDNPTTILTTTIQTTVHLDEFATNITNTHNEKRSLHQDTPNILYSLEIATVSQQYADEYTCDGVLTHHNNALYGENLALGYETLAAVTAWYDEITKYDYNNPGFSESTGHFTQLVWSNTTLVGCGYKDCGSYYGQYTVCQYYSPGNYAGLYGTYVKPLKSQILKKSPV